MKTAISPSRQPKTEPSANSIDFLDEDLDLVPASGIPEEFRKLSRYLPVIVLVPKSAVHDKTTQKKSGSNKSVTGPINTRDVCLPLEDAPRMDSAGPLTENLRSYEKELIEAALAESKGKVAGPYGAAAKLGVPPSTLHLKIKQLNIKKNTVR
jgi:transcriptional regulator with GAF, ATPase, and Fis domain